MPISAFNRFVLKQNLVWAWRKAAFLYRRTDGLQDQEHVAEFDLDLEKNLDEIAEDLEAGRYELAPIRLLPQPKVADGNAVRSRQSFQVSVRDQVTWIALVNAIGPSLDRKMPPWSYGHRLHRSAWVPDVEEGDRRTKIGPYRHSGAQLFRRFRQSWPLYRRHIALTARSLAAGGIDQQNLDEGERRVLATQFDEQSPNRLAYLEPGYFGTTDGSAYYVGFDLKTFYPSIRPTSIVAALHRHSSEVDSDPRLLATIERLLDFRVSTHGLSKALKASVEPSTKNGPLNGLPTGLMVAGFLSNVALLSVDEVVASEVGSRRIAHFRFVDDHTCVGPSFDALLSWIERYRTILHQELPDTRLNEEKFQPELLGHLLSAQRRSKNTRTSQRKLDQHYNAAAASAKVEPAYPRPLLTRTLAQLSLLGQVNFDVLGDQGQKAQIDQLEALLLTDLPEAELRADTRRSYASSRLASAVPRLRDNVAELTRLLRQLRQATIGLKNAQNDMASSVREVADSTERKQLVDLQDRMNSLSTQVKAQRDRIAAERNMRFVRTFNLLIDAFLRHPHKARLLQQILSFCRATGYDGLSIVFEKIWSFERSQYPTFAFLLGLTFQTLASHVLRAAYEMKSQDHDARRRDTAREFLACVAKVDIKTQENYSEFYLGDAARCLAVALEAAAIFLEDSSQTTHSNALCAQQLRRLIATLSINIENHLGAGVKSNTAAWLHFIEGICSRPWATDPSVVWRKLSVNLEPQTRLDRVALRRYPAVLPESALRLIGTKSWPLEKRDLGWLYDVVKEISLEKRDIPAKLAARAHPLLKEHVDRIDLIGWAAECVVISESFDGEGAFDPRVSEWTALEILRQIISIDDSFDQHQVEPIWHPANYTVPKSWCEKPSERWRRTSATWTWESWRAFSQSTGTVERKRRGLVHDYRYIEDGGAAPIDQEQARMVAYGLLLFGLLRRSFALPSIWNIPGQHRAHVGLIGANARYLPISSDTLSIIEGLARPRSRESVLMVRAPGFAGAKDVADLLNMPSDKDLDVPVLADSLDIHGAVEAAQKNLELFQFSVMQHRPRQLTPVSVKVLERLKLADVVESGQQE
ncbi:MAG: hypothetical protein PS018_24270 [bacterium]|nr:hypothetical protein [bacterium]